VARQPAARSRPKAASRPAASRPAASRTAADRPAASRRGAAAHPDGVNGHLPLSPRGARTRAALVAAAREVFERAGFLDARITDITAKAGVATGSFYTYFSDKEQAFAAVMEEVEEEMLHPRLVAPVADRDDPVAVIEATNRAYLAAYRRNAKLMGLMEQVAQIDPDFRRLRVRRTRAFAERNTQALERLQQRGLADPELDAELAAIALSAMVSRTAYLRYVLGFGNASSEMLSATLTRLWVGALGINPHSQSKTAKEIT
jgi:AcrR family transcriptional regulator